MRRQRQQLPLLILFIVLALSCISGLALDDMRLRADMERLQKQAAIEKQSAIDTPYPSVEWCLDQMQKLKEENTRLREALNGS